MTEEKKRPLVILTGPTAVGKTALSVRLAKKIGAEIISADSMQVYKGMDIGSAKVSREEMEGVPHYLIDVLEPTEPFHVVRFQELAREAMEQIYKAGHIPLIAGGTGFYIQALAYAIDFTDSAEDGGFREELERLADEKGNDYLYRLLEEADPEYAAQNHPNNRKRVIRALEYIRQTGEKFSLHNEQERQKASPYQLAYFVLTMDRARLYGRIDRRIDQMLADGLVDEVRGLMEKGCRRGMTSMQGLGYQEILDYLSGEKTLEEAVETLKRDTRHYAKRQLTWLRRERDVIWVDKDRFRDEADILDFMVNALRQKGMIENG